MINWLINVLTPIFTNMGVSETDVEQYVNALSGYIYGILGLLIVMIVVMIGAHWFAKEGDTSCCPLERSSCMGCMCGCDCECNLLWTNV